VTGESARTVFAGWFKAGPSFLSVLRSDTVPMTTRAAEPAATP